MSLWLKLALIVTGTGAAVTPIKETWAQANSGTCAPVAIPNHYGPVDYVAAAGTEALDVVNRAHFTASVESLLKGKSGFVEQDLVYTLNAVPNHHRALLAVSRFAIREGTDHPTRMRYAVSCYFDRATRFRPNDTVVRGLYAKYLYEFLKRKDQALQQVNIAVQSAGDNPLSHYNAGLLYFEIGDLAKAAEQATTAYALGFPRTELIERLISAGAWPAKSNSLQVIPNRAEAASANSGNSNQP